jgi:hypothetical protein|tara:strand:- start:179 stop:628 length:450 start_codon:yes stop_codon:yes gene_type:complete
MKGKNLKLNATSDEDLRVVSAHLQDSITQVGNIVHLKKNKMFLIQFNRFMWEDVEKGVFRKNRRVQSVLKFENILDVYSKNLNQKKKDRFLNFLAIESKYLSDKNYEITLHFAGDILIEIKAEVIDCFLDDQGESWETKNKPKHNFFND